MKRLAAGLLVLAGCIDDDLCPLVSFSDAFQLVLSSESWPSGQYKVVVSFQDEYGAASLQCEAPVPALPALDAGIAPDAGVDALGRFSCFATPGTTTWRRAGGRAGQELVLDFEGTPSIVHVTVSDAGRPVLEQDVTLSYQIVRPYGDECPGPLRAAARIELPQ
jgi:hypothetical protein